MAKYPNRAALYDAHNIYRDVMRRFVFRCLKKIQGTTPEKELCRILKLELIDDPKVAIDINDFPRIIRDRDCWINAFSLLFGSRGAMDIRGMTSVIADGRKLWAHPGAKDVDSEPTRMHLSLIADVLDGINETDAKHEVEAIRDRLFSDEPEEHPAEVENADLKKHLTEMSNRLAVVETEKAEYKESHEAELKRLEVEKAEYAELLDTVEKEKIELEERLETTSTRLEDAEAEITVYMERVAHILRQLDGAKAEQADYLSAEESLALTLTELEIEDVEEIEYEDDLSEIEEHLPTNAVTPDSVTFQGTTFTLHLDKYCVTGDDIPQTFWHYWHAQGREGKQEMRDAGWSVERVDRDWEVTIAPEDFQSWIENEVTELNNPLDSSQNEEPATQPPRSFYGKTVLPTGKEMEEPALVPLADGGEHRRVEIIDRLTEHFSLTDDERSYLSKTGRAEKHLVNKGLIESTRKRYYRITARGLQVLRRDSG